jgi:murein DD-endopeptidase MepM/ murein hydrolase activator NlpD
MLGLVLIAGLVGSNAYFYKNWSESRHCKRELSHVLKENQEQKIQLASFNAKFNEMSGEFARLQEFNTKIRVMVDLDQTSFGNDVNSVGGPRTKDIDDDFLPLYRTERLARRMHAFVEQLSTDAKLEELRQQEILSFIKEKKDILARTPSIWPTTGWVTSNFGYRRSPFTGQRELHKGLDISAPLGTPIYASASGKVVKVERDHGYGKNIMVDHGSGIVTRYAHLNNYAVKKGEQVKRGQLIGYVGNTGRSTGPHLHYEVRLNGVPVNPLRYILD